MKFIPKALTALLCSSAMLLSAAVHAEEINRHNFKIAFVQAKDHPHGLGAQKFAEIIKEKSGGKMKVMVFASGTLGGDAQVISSVQGGTVDMTLVTPGLLSGIEKGFALYGLPFLFQDTEEVDAVLDGPAGQNLLTTLEPHGIIGLGYWDHGFRHVTNSKHPVEKVEDLKGLKLRLQQIPTAIESFRALGASVVPLSFTELYTAMETRTVDGQENPLAAIETSKFYEVQKYLTVTNHVYSPWIVTVSKRWWDGLSQTEQNILLEAAKKARDFERKDTREEAARALAELKDKGMQINEVEPAEVQRMREQAAPAIQKVVDTVGQQLFDQVQAEAEKAAL